MSADGATSGVATRWQSVVSVATGLSVIAGVLIALTQLFEFADSARRSELHGRLATLGHVQEFLKADETVRRRGRAFVRQGLPALLPDLQARVRSAGSGEDFYLSPEMVDFAAMHYHYEHMGALVKRGYLDFGLIFEIIAFPDDYLRAVEPVRAAVAQHWKGIDQPLPDFGENIRYLKACYQYSRHCAPATAACPSPQSVPAWMAWQPGDARSVAPPC